MTPEEEMRLVASAIVSLLVAIAYTVVLALANVSFSNSISAGMQLFGLFYAILSMGIWMRRSMVRVTLVVIIIVGSISAIRGWSRMATFPLVCLLVAWVQSLAKWFRNKSPTGAEVSRHHD